MISQSCTTAGVKFGFSYLNKLAARVRRGCLFDVRSCFVLLCILCVPLTDPHHISFLPRTESLQARHSVSQGLPAPPAYSNSVSNFVQMNSLWRWRLFKAVRWGKKSTNIVIRTFHCVCVCVCGLGVKWQRFSTEPLWSSGVLLFTCWQTQWCIGRGRLGRTPTTLWRNTLHRQWVLATYRRVC